MLKRIRRFENLHIVLWLVKDTCWIQNFHLMACIMIAPTIGMALYITWLSRSIVKEWLHNLAVCSWIIANSIWMIGEFFFDDTLRPFATVFFLIGLSIIGYYYLVLARRSAQRG